MNAEVFNSETGAEVDAQDLVGYLVEGDYNETMLRFEHRLHGAGERAGTYTMLVHATGFDSWSRDDIEVDADSCHVIPQVIDVHLVPTDSM